MNKHLLKFLTTAALLLMALMPRQAQASDWVLNDSQYDAKHYTDPQLGMTDFNWKAYTIERTGIDKMTFTVPALPDDIDSKLSSIRMRKCTYDVVYTFYKQDGTTATVTKQSFDKA